jgi:hypothetical protein
MSPIATTELDARLPDGSVRHIIVQVATPQQFDDRAECSVAVLGIDDKVRTLYGEDTLQALSIALRYALSELESVETHWNWIFELEGIPFPEWRVLFAPSDKRS